MKEFVAVDFETANPQRVSACSIGYAKVSNCEILETKSFLMKPVGGHASFQSKIHGIKEDHTNDKPNFLELFPTIEEIFNYQLVAHSIFDKQVLNALSNHYDIGLCFEYIDTCAMAKRQLPDLKNHKLKTLAKHFGLPAFQHHDAGEDAVTCAKIFLNLIGESGIDFSKSVETDISEFTGLIKGILADNEVNYKEVYGLLYWLEDHTEVASRYKHLFAKTKEALDDEYLDVLEEDEIKGILQEVLHGLKK